MTDTSEQVRREFEAWMFKKAPYFNSKMEHEGDGYSNAWINGYWRAYLAGRESAGGAEPLATCDLLPTFPHELDNHMGGAKCVNRATFATSQPPAPATSGESNQEKIEIAGHAWEGTCFSHSGRYGNCECGKADYVTYSQHQKHLASLVPTAAPTPDDATLQVGGWVFKDAFELVKRSRSTRGLGRISDDVALLLAVDISELLREAVERDREERAK